MAGLLACLAVAPSATLADSYTYTSFDGPSNANGTNGTGINNSGVVVGFTTNASYHPQSFEYSGGTNGTYTPISDPNGSVSTSTYANGINASG